MILVLMGVSGCGKSCVGKSLSEKLNWAFVDADDHHPQENIRKMASGNPLQDEDRHPWLLILHKIIINLDERGINTVLACSALEKTYRNLLIKGRVGNEDLSTHGLERSKVLFVHLEAESSFVEARLGKRTNHFMPTSLLKTQYSTLEAPGADENHLTVDASQPLHQVVDSILTHKQVKSTTLKISSYTAQ